MLVRPALVGLFLLGGIAVASPVRERNEIVRCELGLRDVEAATIGRIESAGFKSAAVDIARRIVRGSCRASVLMWLSDTDDVVSVTLID